MRTLVLVWFILALSASQMAGSASAKDFRPGDLRICGAENCVSVRDMTVLNSFDRFYYSGPVPARARAPELGVSYFELRYRNGYVTGIAATAQLDRFLSYGVNTGQFARGRWFSVPPRAAHGLERLTAALKPLRLTRSAIALSR
jgi:hypothetical protein